MGDGMTQLGLNLDQFEHIREMVSISVDVMADIAIDEAHKAVEHQRRSLGQIVRWQEWRMAK